MHQFVTSTFESSGVIATYFGTEPTAITWSILKVLVSIRYTKLLSYCPGREHASAPSGPKPLPYIE